MKTGENRERLYRKLVRKQKIGAFLAASVVKRKRTLWDKLKVWIFTRIAPPPQPGNDFMRDEICDNGVEFSPEELRAFRARQPQQERVPDQA